MVQTWRRWRSLTSGGFWVFQIPKQASRRSQIGRRPPPPFGWFVNGGCHRKQSQTSGRQRGQRAAPRTKSACLRIIRAQGIVNWIGFGGPKRKRLSVRGPVSSPAAYPPLWAPILVRSSSLWPALAKSLARASGLCKHHTTPASQPDSLNKRANQWQWQWQQTGALVNSQTPHQCE